VLDRVRAPEHDEPPGSPYGSGRRRTPFTIVKMAVLAPIPSVSAATARSAKIGLRANMRHAYRASIVSDCQFMGVLSLCDRRSRSAFVKHVGDRADREGRHHRAAAGVPRRDGDRAARAPSSAPNRSRNSRG
jgi:hypothetical protein